MGGILARGSRRLRLGCNRVSAIAKRVSVAGVLGWGAVGWLLDELSTRTGSVCKQWWSCQRGQEFVKKLGKSWSGQKDCLGQGSGKVSKILQKPSKNRAFWSSPGRPKSALFGPPGAGGGPGRVLLRAPGTRDFGPGAVFGVLGKTAKIGVFGVP